MKAEIDDSDGTAVFGQVLLDAKKAASSRLCHSAPLPSAGGEGGGEEHHSALMRAGIAA